jgi:hypothetical protein
MQDLAERFSTLLQDADAQKPLMRKMLEVKPRQRMKSICPHGDNLAETASMTRF